jgi:flagellar motility protein MotE (MotC chaperone)
VALVALLTAKLILAGFVFGRSFLAELFKPTEASAQEVKKADPPKAGEPVKKDAPAKAVKAEDKDKGGPVPEGKAGPDLLGQALQAKPSAEQTPAQAAPAKPEETGAQEQAKSQPEPPGLGPGQLELLRTIEAQKKQLEAKEKDLARRMEELNNLQKLIDDKMVALEKVKKEFEAQVAAEQARQNARIKHLIGVYTNMKPKAAAEVIEKMETVLAVDILRGMKGKDAGKVLALIKPEVASRLSLMLSEQR